MNFKKNVLILSLLLGSSLCFSDDNVMVVAGQSSADVRHTYPHKILKMALDATVNEYGPYSFEYVSANMSRNRALVELKEGRVINVHEAPTRSNWEEEVIPVRIPIRKGLLGYRLFFINEGNQKTFTDLRSVDELKQLRAGLGSQWSTTLVMKNLDFNVITGSDYEGLFSMLASGRFDYFPRGVSEIFNEYESHHTSFPNMIIESNKALYFTTPTYFFVSPKYPELAKRIEEGLLSIIEDGSFDLAFYKEFGTFLQAANLSGRTLFRLRNNTLSLQTPLDEDLFWYVPN